MVLASGVSETARTLDRNMTETIPYQPSKTVLHPNQEQLILVLHVDDNEDFLLITKRHLEQRGSFQIEPVSSVKEAKRKIAQKQYDAIICDYQMPEKTGLEFLKELRDDRNDVPFILFTGEGREEVAIEALNFGADRYFNKNETPEIVYVELVHSLIKSVKAKRAKEEVRSLAKFPSEDPNPVLRIAKDGTTIYANKAARMYRRNNNSEKKDVVTEELKKAVVISLSSGLTEEVEIEYGAQTFSFVVAPIPEEGYANIYGRNITESKAAWNSLEETMKELVMINEKLGVVGRLTRHDDRNKLSVVLNNIYLAKQRLDDDPVTLDYLRGIESAVEQLEKIFDFARTYELLGAEELSYANVENSINEAATLF
jgi:CheY-like chemotaxis protein